eukprot:6176130-Alexandrium_andersonii.AAC.1
MPSPKPTAVKAAPAAAQPTAAKAAPAAAQPPAPKPTSAKPKGAPPVLDLKKLVMDEVNVIWANGLEMQRIDITLEEERKMIIDNVAARAAEVFEIEGLDAMINQGARWHNGIKLHHRRWGNAWYNKHGDVDPVHPVRVKGVAIDVSNPTTRPKECVEKELLVHPLGCDELFKELVYLAEYRLGGARVEAMMLDMLQGKNFPPVFVNAHVGHYEMAKQEYQEAMRAIHRLERAREVNEEKWW